MITIRPAIAADADAMAALLNQIIAIGGTTAFETPVAPDTIRHWMAKDGPRAAWHVAQDDTGLILGYQSCEPHSGLPPAAGDIASFVQVNQAGRGIGRRLFEATKIACRALGYTWINAAIRSDNQSGLTYYTAMGFIDWKHDPTAALADGTITGKTYKRYDL